MIAGEETVVTYLSDNNPEVDMIPVVTPAKMIDWGQIIALLYWAGFIFLPDDNFALIQKDVCFDSEWPQITTGALYINISSFLCVPFQLGTLYYSFRKKIMRNILMRF